MTQEKRQKVLAITLAILAGILGLRYLLPALGSGGGSGGDTLSGRSRDGVGPMPELTELRLEDLENRSGEFQIGRDPFRYYVAPRQAPPPQQTVAPPPPPAPRTRPQRPQAQRRQGPQPPPVDVTYLGSFGPDRGRVAVFTDGSDLYNARIGDVVKTHFVVESIGFESADLKFVNFPDEPAQRLVAGG